MSMISPVLFWLIVLIVALVLEALTVQLVTIWCAAGALGALIAAALNVSFGVQLGVFIVLTAALVVLLRPIVYKLLRPKQDKTNADRIIGQTAVVMQTIDNRAERGQVRVFGQIWTARSAQPGDVIAEGEEVVVQSIAGVKAIVSRKE